MIKLLVVDDSALVRKLLGQVFGREPDFEVQFARNGLEALERLQTFAPDVVTLDIQMPSMEGLECLDRIMIERPCPVVMVSTLTADGAELTLEALRLGAVDFVLKPDRAVSLRIDEIAPELVAKVRAAAGAKLKRSLRLRERVRHRIGTGAARVASRKGTGAASGEGIGESARAPAEGDGLVLVGSSTGGPPALETLLSGLPATFPWPILVAQHMPATFTGPLAKRLDGLTELNVCEVVRPTVLRPGCAYIGRGDSDIVVSRRAGALVGMAAPKERGYPWHPSTDRLVRSAMNLLPPGQLIGVLMTGMGNDGAQAMAELHALGGRTIAESEETAVVWGMPGELVKAKGAEWVLPLQAIADRLQKMTP